MVVPLRELVTSKMSLASFTEMNWDINPLSVIIGALAVTCRVFAMSIVPGISQV